MRAVPFMPYLNFAPSAWVLLLKIDGGAYRAGGKAMLDSEGNLWVGNSFTIGWQGQDSLSHGNATKFAPNGHPLSPMTTGFAGGGAADRTGARAIALGHRPAACGEIRQDRTVSGMSRDAKEPPSHCTAGD